MFSLARALEQLTGRRRGAAATVDARAACGRFLRRTRAAERTAAATAAVSVAWTLAVSGALLLLALDLLLAPGGTARELGALALAGASAALLAGALVMGFGRRVSNRWLAQRIEARYPELDGRLLVVASERSPQPAVDAFVPELARVVARLSAHAVPGRRPLHATALLALATTLAGALSLVVYARIAPARLGRVILFQDEPAGPAAASLLAVRPGAARVVEGARLGIEVGCTSTPARAALLLLPRDPEARADAREIALEPRAFGRLAATTPPLVEDAAYQVVIDGNRSAVFPIDVIHAPRVVSVAHTDTAPAYLGIEPREVQGGEVDAIEGTTIHVRATTSSLPLGGKLRAVWTGEGLIATIPLAVTGPRTLEGEFVARQGGTYRIGYEDATGLAQGASADFTVSVRPDLPPRCEILAPAADRAVPRAGSVLVDYEVRDDHGLGAVALHVAIKGGEAKKLPLPFVPGARVAKGSFVLSPRQLGLLPGDSVLYYIAAEDKKTPVPNHGASAPYVLVVDEDAPLRQVLSGIDPRDEEGLRALETDPRAEAPDGSTAGEPRTEEELARDLDALRRLEALVNGESDPTQSPTADDPLKDLQPGDSEALAKALEDLDLDPEQFLDKPESGATQKGAKGNPAADPRKGNAGRPPARGMKGSGADAARDSELGPSYLTRVTRKDLLRRYRELLAKRRELLRRLAEQLAEGKPIPEALARRFGAERARFLDALKNGSTGEAPDAEALTHSHEEAPGHLLTGARALRVREEIPRDAVQLVPRTDAFSTRAPAASGERAPDWDETLPPELREVVRQYFKTR
jgi:hypothetical protein